MGIDMDIKTIENMKKEIADAEREIHILTGKVEAKREELKEKFGVSSDEEGRKLLDSLEKEEEELEQQIKDILKKLKANTVED